MAPIELLRKLTGYDQQVDDMQVVISVYKELAEANADIDAMRDTLKILQDTLRSTNES